VDVFSGVCLSVCMCLLGSPCVADADIIFSSCGFFYLSSLFSSPNLSRRRSDVYRTSTHGVALVRIKNAGLKCAARGVLEIQNAKIAKKLAIWAPSHNLSGCFFATKARIDNGKNSLNNNISSTYPHNMLSFSPLTAEICSVVWGTPANFNGFCVLALLLKRCRSPAANQTLHDVWPSLGLV